MGSDPHGCGQKQRDKLSFLKQSVIGKPTSYHRWDMYAIIWAKGLHYFALWNWGEDSSNWCQIAGSSPRFLEMQPALPDKIVMFHWQGKWWSCWLLVSSWAALLLGFVVCMVWNPYYHDDIIKWKHFPHYWPFHPLHLCGEQRALTWNFHVFFDLRLNKRLSKQCWGWWFEMPLHPLWCHYNDFVKSKGGKPMSMGEFCACVLDIINLLLSRQFNGYHPFYINAAKGMDFVQWILVSFIVCEIIDWLWILFNNKLLLIYSENHFNYYWCNNHAYPLVKFCSLIGHWEI